MRSIPIDRLLMNVAKAQGVVFRLGDETVHPLVVFGESAYMPAIAYFAEGLAQDTIGWSLGVQMSRHPDAVFGLRLEPQALRASHFQGSLTGLMYLRGADLCFGWKKNKDVDLKRVYDRMFARMSAVEGSLESPKEHGG